MTEMWRSLPLLPRRRWLAVLLLIPALALACVASGLVAAAAAVHLAALAIAASMLVLAILSDPPRPPRDEDPGDDSSHGGSDDGPLPPDAPGGPSVDWDRFERELQAYVSAREGVPA